MNFEYSRCCAVIHIYESAEDHTASKISVSFRTIQYSIAKPLHLTCPYMQQQITSSSTKTVLAIYPSSCATILSIHITAKAQAEVKKIKSRTFSSTIEKITKNAQSQHDYGRMHCYCNTTPPLHFLHSNLQQCCTATAIPIVVSSDFHADHRHEQTTKAMSACVMMMVVFHSQSQVRTQWMIKKAHIKRPADVFCSLLAYADSHW